MGIWLIVDGEKKGPFPAYEIRGKIQRGELGPDEPLWHDGLEKWTPAVEIELFRKEFDLDSRGEAEEEFKLPRELPEEFLERAKTAAEAAARAAAEGPRPRAYVARRFWARWMDLFAYGAVWWLGMYYSGRDIAATMENPWLLLSMYIPWFVVEAWLIHTLGTTPGKWLMGLKVRNEDDSMLSLRSAIWRSVRVLISGIGFGWQLLAILCQGMSWFSTRRIGKPVWDYLGKHKVVAAPIHPIKVGALVILFFTSIQLQMAVRWPHAKQVWLENYPETESWILENDDVWTLPVKQRKAE